MWLFLTIVVSQVFANDLGLYLYTTECINSSFEYWIWLVYGKILYSLNNGLVCAGYCLPEIILMAFFCITEIFFYIFVRSTASYNRAV